MKWLVWAPCIAVFAVLAVLAFGQTFERGKVYVITHADGHMTIETAELLIQADAGNRNTDTREILLRGDVSVKLKQMPSH